MPGFDAPRSQASPEPASARNTRLGLGLFALYLAVYAVYVLLNAFYPEALDVVLLGGVNLGILYGLVLIVSAFVLALLYTWLCRPAAGGEKRP